MNCSFRAVEACALFTERFPALGYALFLWIGAAFSFTHSPIFFFPIALSFVSFYLTRSKRYRLRLIFCYLLTIAAFFYSSASYRFPPLPESGHFGSALFEPLVIKEKKHLFGSRWQVQGRIKAFTPSGSKESIAKNIPCTLSFSKIPDSKHMIICQGVLKEDERRYLLKLDKKSEIRKGQKLFSLIEMRMRAKEAFKLFLKKHIKGVSASEFLSGTATGSFDDPLLASQLRRFGLQHLIAISGFHFAIVASALYFLLSTFMPRQGLALLLTALLGSYFLFLGPSPSVLRAFLTAEVTLFAMLFRRRSSSLNALGAAMAAIFFYEPLLIQNVGLLFSVGITASILIFTPIFTSLLHRLLPRRPLSEVLQMPLTDQHAYCVNAFLCKGAALTLAVNLAAVPISLFAFGTFPLMGLVYNLFFPFLVSIALILLMLSAPFALIFPWFTAPMQLTSAYTGWILRYVYHVPLMFDWQIHYSLSSSFCIAYFTLLFLIGANLLAKKENEELSFAFV